MYVLHGPVGLDLNNFQPEIPRTAADIAHKKNALAMEGTSLESMVGRYTATMGRLWKLSQRLRASAYEQQLGPLPSVSTSIFQIKPELQQLIPYKKPSMQILYLAHHFDDKPGLLIRIKTGTYRHKTANRFLATFAPLR